MMLEQIAMVPAMVDCIEAVVYCTLKKVGSKVDNNYMDKFALEDIALHFLEFAIALGVVLYFLLIVLQTYYWNLNQL